MLNIGSLCKAIPTSSAGFLDYYPKIGFAGTMPTSRSAKEFEDYEQQSHQKNPSHR
jgi:hypothetical protein